MQAVAKKANTLHAQASPNFAYIAGLMSGKMAAPTDRVTTVDAIALAQ